MGGRYPHSKKGIVKYESMKLPPEIEQQILWRIEELADHLGYELKPKSMLKMYDINADSIRIADYGSSFRINDYVFVGNRL